jgi:pimeloyl-ACP methyl ester carboxylesterase
MLDSGFPIVPEIIERSVTVLKYVPQTFDSRKEARIFAKILPASLGYSWTPLFDDYFNWTFKDEPDGRCSFRYDKQAMLQATSHLSDDLWEDAAKVQCPVLVSVAGESGIIADDGARKLAEVIPQGEFLALEGTRHLVFLEEDLRPVEKITREYLQKIGVLGTAARAS